MKIEILISKKDEAGINIAEHLKKENISFNLLEKQSIFSEGIDEKISADFFIFATTHQGKDEKVLSVHAPGNWNKADFGGKDKQICPTSAKILKIFFQELNKNIPSGWKTSMESTHHGPYLETSCLFIEIGSNKNNWKDKIAGKHIADTIKNSMKRIQSDKHNLKFIPTVAIGGPHYCPNFNKIQLTTNYAIGHVIPEYALKNFDEAMLIEALNKTKEKVSTAILDWKGCGKSEERQKIIDILEKNNLEVLRTDKIEK